MEFKINKVDRNGKIALFVPVPNTHDSKNTDYNIWDLEPELANNKEVLSAIKHAFELGFAACHNLVVRNLGHAHFEDG